jgi:signal transduction histidine kinase
MAIGTIIFVSFAVSRPLRSLSRFAAASEAMGKNVQAARPIEENGPVEIRNAARAFNTMQSRVQRLLEARSEMLGAISHDFRTPLTRLRLRVESMRDDEQRDKAIRDLDEMETLIKFTLDFVRDEAMEEPRRSVNLASLLRSLVSDLDPTGAMVTIEVAPDINIVCQPIGLRRVLGNVIENGIFYGDRVLVSATMHEDGVTMDVDDAGPGIKQADRERVFVPFYRLETSRNRETGGTGLGLSIAQTIVHSHGGSIELHDSPLGGLRVRIMLPII